MLVASLATATGLSVLDKSNSKVIDADTLCEKSKKVVASQNKIDSTDIPEFTSEKGFDPVKRDLFLCKYFMKDANPKTSENDLIHRKYNITYQVVNNSFVESINEKSIDRGALESICNDSKVYVPEFERTGKYDPKVHLIKSHGLVFQDSTETNVYPVYRWKCKYKLMPKKRRRIK
ncbi:hypothetical protein HRE53_17565 [Acaryochloris sp. 'Moss Beach']|uniref:hypothetical protein n=1 Tax=Acaryochloris sp. 'Moss Beach' TaxID=2740837 RepID=UPI001F2C05BB|nr:hypothetical protein [Acaryochloris sp. 'Moss Beach']UJB68349.1 hypothetical protein HRE53_17565 [Acaryochloris sp. 'Moss Beach']